MPKPKRKSKASANREAKQSKPAKKGLLERLAEGPVIGDGSFLLVLERRGYVKAGYWTPEAVVEHPEAVAQLHREYARAGADVSQSFTFYASEDKLKFRGNEAAKKYGVNKINEAACSIAKGVADEYGTLLTASLSPTPSYLEGKGKDVVQAEFKVQTEIFKKYDVDFFLVEFFPHLEETLWAIEVCKEYGKPVVASMRIGPDGDRGGNSPGKCAVEMAKAGADVVGQNCHFDYTTSLQTIELMKAELEKEGLSPYLMMQPPGYHVPEANKGGMSALSEYPFAFEPRLLTRWEAQDFARKAFDVGVRYLGGCCGMEPYHIRGIAEELSTERGGRLGEASENHGMWGASLSTGSFLSTMTHRVGKDYWMKPPATGRPFSASYSAFFEGKPKAP
ncbi:betaine--homocysteine S-methyltransferase 1-like [Oscarella lobularis]|uniref:betaine--homocysteine S-methyltransferase 1-like n=1 Tax=Oscarella lobularis TaxID=121494 RepID=UPI003314402F